MLMVRAGEVRTHFVVNFEVLRDESVRLSQETGNPGYNDQRKVMSTPIFDK